jgi:phytoene synthase
MSGSLGARITRRSGSSFYYAFRVLPAARRAALYALYAFCREVDDCVDEVGGEGEAGLQRWEEEVDRCYAGRPQTELGRELAAAVSRYPIPRRSLEDIISGCRMDLVNRRYPTFAELRLYCERVASAVGLASIEIFGYSDPRAREYATELGLALQLTNILRDVGPDAARDRIYLPLEDLARFGVTQAELLVAVREPEEPRSANLDDLLAFEAGRARSHYAAAAAFLPERDRHSMLAAEIMGAVYRALLEEWTRRRMPVGGARVRLGRCRRLGIALRTIPRVRWGV